MNKSKRFIKELMYILMAKKYLGKNSHRFATR